MKSAIFIKDNDVERTCLISGKIFKQKDYDNDDVVKLQCGHIFEYSSIFESYKITNNKGRNYLSKQLCPYCLQKGGLLPIKEDQEYIKGVNYKSTKSYRTKNKNESFKCCAIITSGINKGKTCNNNCKITFLTLEHKPFYILDIDITKENISVTLHSKTWCGKHISQCEKFIADAGNLNNYSEKNKYVKLYYRKKLGYIYTTPNNLETLEQFINLDNYDNYNKNITLRRNKYKKIVSLDYIIVKIKELKNTYNHDFNNILKYFLKDNYA